MSEKTRESRRKPEGHEHPRARAGKEADKEPEQQMGSENWERVMSRSQERPELKTGKPVNNVRHYKSSDRMSSEKCSLD